MLLRITYLEVVTLLALQPSPKKLYSYDNLGTCPSHFPFHTGPRYKDQVSPIRSKL